MWIDYRYLSKIAGTTLEWQMFHLHAHFLRFGASHYVSLIRVLQRTWKMTHLASVPDFERYAAVHLPTAGRDYYWSGAAAQQTLRENQDAFRRQNRKRDAWCSFIAQSPPCRLRLRPRVLHRDVSRVSTETTILGNRIEFPIGAAPTALQRMAHEDGEIATAKGETLSVFSIRTYAYKVFLALAALGTCMTLSSWSTVKTEDVARSAPDGLRWFQLYVYSDLDLTLSLVREAEAAGYKAIALTVDRPILGIKYNDKRNRFRLPSRLTLENFVDKISTISERKEGNYSGLARHVSGLVDSTWDWDKLTWLMSVTKLPIVLKGIITREDAREAVRRGVAGIWVSNHGGRQLDGAPATVRKISILCLKSGL